MSCGSPTPDRSRKHNLTRTHVLPLATALFPNPIGESTRYAEAGIPVVQLMSGPAYLFTADDTIDKVAVDRLAQTARAVADLIEYADRSLPARQ